MRVLEGMDGGSLTDLADVEYCLCHFLGQCIRTGLLIHGRKFKYLIFKQQCLHTVEPSGTATGSHGRRS